MQTHPLPALASYAIPVVVIAIVMALRWRRMSRERPLKLERLWILPALDAGLAAILLTEYPPVGWAWAFCAVALAMGAALGWQRGRLMTITVDPQTHALSQRGSPAAMLLLMAIVALRFGARGLVGAGNPLHLDTVAVTDVLLSLALGLIVATRVEMYLRAKRTLDAARGVS